LKQEGYTVKTSEQEIITVMLFRYLAVL
jgi:hypothetical protein